MIFIFKSEFYYKFGRKQGVVSKTMGRKLLNILIFISYLASFIAILIFCFCNSLNDQQFLYPNQGQSFPHSFPSRYLYFQTWVQTIIIFNMNTLEVEKLGHREESRFVMRTFDKNWHCQLFIPKPIQSTRDERKRQLAVQAQIMLQEAFYFSRSVYNGSFMIENYNFFANGEYFKIDQEYYGKTLCNLNTYTTKYEEKINIITEIAKIVRHYNNQNICLQALRPEILSYSKYGNNLQVKLIWIDFGVILQKNKTQPKRFQSKQFAQFQAYVAPQIRNKRLYTKKADVWSLGVIFYYLLFGSTYGIKIKNQSVDIEYPVETPKWLEKVLSYLLEVDPNKRCSIEVCLQYLKPMRLCAETASKMMPKNIIF